MSGGRFFPETPPGTLRLFFALWPGDDVREQMAAQRDRMKQDYGGSHGVTTARFHMTLLFMADFPGRAAVAVDGLRR